MLKPIKQPAKQPRSLVSEKELRRQLGFGLFEDKNKTKQIK